MTTKSKNVSRNKDQYESYVDLKSSEDDEWTNMVRSLRVEDNKETYDATVEEWWIEDETAYIAFHMPYFDRVFYGKKDAQLYPEQSSEFEKFVGSYGHSINNPDMLPEGTKIKVQPNRTEKGIFFEPINNPQDESSILSKTILSGAFFGLFPILNYIMIFECLVDIEKSPADSQFTIKNNINFLIGSIITSTVMTFFLGMIYFVYLEVYPM